jgi:hypothetical protein
VVDNFYAPLIWLDKYSDFKTKFIKAIKDSLLGQLEAPMTLRGKVKYGVMTPKHYQYLRECELEAALAESNADLAGGKFVKETVADHIKNLK